jgi:hypothetical protein
MQKYTLTIKEKKKEQYNPHTRTVEFSCIYDDLKLDNTKMAEYLNKLAPKGYFVMDIKKEKDKKAD